MSTPRDPRSLAFLAAVAVLASSLLSVLAIAGMGGTNRDAAAQGDPAQVVLPRPEPADALSVMSFNIASHHGCAQASTNMTCMYDDPSDMLDVVAKLIVENGVDVAGLQEVDRNTNRHGGADMATMLATKLDDLDYSMMWHFQPYAPPPAHVTQGSMGIMVLSRLPEVSYDATVTLNSVGNLGSPTQQLVVDINGDNVRVYNIHASVQQSCTSITPTIVDDVQDHLSEFTIALGDFNDPPTTPCMVALGQTHESACLVSPDPACEDGIDLVQHPNHLWNVDHVYYRFSVGSPAALVDAWYDASINALADAYPGPNWVSDHHPILTRFALNTPSPLALGDADCSNTITLRDALVIAQHVVAPGPETEVCPNSPAAINVASADADQDGTVTDKDAYNVLTCLAGMAGASCE